MGARLLPQRYQYPNLSEGADGVDAGQLRGDEEWRNKSGRVWRKVPRKRCSGCVNVIDLQACKNPVPQVRLPESRVITIWLPVTLVVVLVTYFER